MASVGKNIAFTGGGTGGHVQPIVSLIEYAQKHKEINSKCKKLYRFGQGGGQEETASRQLQSITFVSISSGKLRRYWGIKAMINNVLDLFRVLGGYVQSIRYLKKYDIDVVFSKGGFVALPVCLAAATVGINVYMHESDMHAGLVNRVVAKIAHTIFVGFPGVFSEGIVVGQIMSDVLAGYTKPVRDRKTNILVMGGSQGAASLFDALLVYLKKSKNNIFQYHVLCGTKNTSYTEVFASYQQVITYGFLSQKELADIYAVCDISLTRGSVTSLAEQQLFGIKKIIVPLPWTGGNHQFYNAVRFSDAYKDIVIEQNESLGEQVSVFLEKLQGYKKKFDRLDVTQLYAAKQTIWSEMLG